MQVLFDFFPLILFFAAFKLYGIYVATAVAMAATFVQVGYMWFRYHEVKPMHIITLVIITLFGGMTLFFQNDAFIKWKPSVINWVFAVLVIGSQFIGKQPAMQRLMGGQISMPDRIWSNVNLSWGLFFALMGVLNMYVAFYYQLDQPEEVRQATWVNFKVFWMMGLTLAFSVVQMLFISKYIDTDSLDASQQEDTTTNPNGEK